jgi:diacylglycerol kinase family enzyme
MAYDESAIVCFFTEKNLLIVVDDSTIKSQLPSLKIIPIDGSDQSYNRFHSTLVKEVQNSQASTSRKAIHVVISILSGTQLAKPFFETLLSKLLKQLGIGDEVEVEFTKSATSITELTESVFRQNARQGHRQLIILLSGDGGIVDILNALGHRDTFPAFCPPEIALLPMGTGNALANSLGIASDKTMGLSTLARGSAHDLPAFRATFSPGARLLVDEARTEEELPHKDTMANPYIFGAVVCSWGLHAGLVADSDTAEYRKFGVDRFKMAAAEALYPKDGSEPHHYKAKLSILRKGETQWQELERMEHAYVLVTLVSNLEKGFTISPLSNPLNGCLRIVHFGPRSGDEVMKLMKLAYDGGKHVEDESVSYEVVDGVRINFERRENDSRWRRICVDGKIIRLEADGWVEVRMEKETLLQLRYLG